MSRKEKIMKRICIWLTVVALIATSAAVLPGTIKAGAAGGVSIAIGDPVFIDEKPGCFNLGLATISGSDTISSMTVSVTNGYIKEAGDMSNAIADKYTNHQTITWLWTTPKSMDNATAFLRSLVFSYAEPMTITITVDGNETKIPKGTTVTSYTPDGETKPHYYMFVPFSGNTDLSDLWMDSYDHAKKQVFMGMKGYLVTITSDEENAVLDRINNIGAWAGALRLPQSSINNGLDKDDCSTYAPTPGKYGGAGTSWVWVCGPEAGQTISIAPSTGAGKNGVNNYGTLSGYSKWNSNQPDGGGGTDEYCLQVHHQNTQYWNDLPTSYPSLVDGYFVEFSFYAGGTVAGYSEKNVHRRLSQYNITG